MEQILFLITFISATVISMAVIPLMVRLAPALGMIDKPDSRKVHTVPVPRVGGVGIVTGSLLPILLWSPAEPWLQAFVSGAVVLLVFGVWDDMRELGHYAKFLGQIIAAVIVVYFGDVYITQLPFITLEGAQVAAIGKPFTVFAIIGMINAVNTSDGLDGLAGGMSLLSLGCIAYLAFLAESGPTVVLIAIATLGGVFGFLRYNTHPARVFMGDGGSQFLGFTLGVLAVVLTQQVNPALNPVLPLLFLGLPIIDILGVIVRRVRRGTKWYLAHKDHIHHRLLQLKFHHYEAVMIIYSIQMFLIACAIFLDYESDALLMSIYLVISALLFLFLTVAERNRWFAHRTSHVSGFAEAIHAIKANRFFTAAPVYFVGISIPVLFVAVGLLAKHVPRDFGIIAAVMAATLAVYFVARVAVDSIFAQAVHYVTAAFVIYLETLHLGQPISGFGILEVVYFLTLAGAIGMVIRYGEKWDFRITPMDYLVIFVVLFAGYILHSMPDKVEVGLMAVKLIVIFYGCELIVPRMRRKLNALNISSLITLVVLAYRGIA
jgi:UDP-GlcNAc:undecaprenyl-phosphate GlcNAc-1-phosphate transferase